MDFYLNCAIAKYLYFFHSPDFSASVDDATDDPEEKNDSLTIIIIVVVVVVVIIIVVVVVIVVMKNKTKSAINRSSTYETHTMSRPTTMISAINSPNMTSSDF